MKPQILDVTIRTTQKKLATIIEVLDNEATLVGVKVVEQEALVINRAPRASHNYTNGHRDKGITGKELVMMALSDGPKTNQQLEEIFRGRGFAGHSYSPATSVLRTEGRVKVVGDKWALANT